MDDYISREAVIDAVCRRCNYAFPEDEPCGDCLAKAAIMAVSAADVKPVRHERWEECTYRYCYGCDEGGEPMYRDRTFWYCSNRTCWRRTDIKEKFCPSCGAIMDLEDVE